VRVGGRSERGISSREAGRARIAAGTHQNRETTGGRPNEGAHIRVGNEDKNREEAIHAAVVSLTRF
jgi:hypothetical protein